MGKRGRAGPVPFALGPFSSLELLCAARLGYAFLV
jgi:hypothetical protein